MRWETHDEEVGKFNGGQKGLFWLSSLAALGVLVTGVVLWFPNLFGRELWQASSEPGTFTGMVKGTVTRAWTRLHHPKWYRDVTGDRR